MTDMPRHEDIDDPAVIRFDLPLQTQNILRHHEITTLRELSQITREEFAGWRNVGNATVRVVTNLLRQHGLCWMGEGVIEVGSAPSDSTRGHKITEVRDLRVDEWGRPSWTEVSREPGVVFVRQVQATSWTVEKRTDCFCCSCGDGGHGYQWTDPHCRNHGFSGRRPCELHGTSVVVDSEHPWTEHLASVQAFNLDPKRSLKPGIGEKAT